MKNKSLKTLKKKLELIMMMSKLQWKLSVIKKEPLDSEDKITMKIAGDPKIEPIYPENQVEISKVIACEPKIEPVYSENKVEITKVIAGEPKPVIDSEKEVEITKLLIGDLKKNNL